MKKILFIVLLVPILTYSQSAFISGNIDLCDNEGKSEITVSFNGITPFTFVYSVNGIINPSITTTENPYSIITDQQGIYELVSMSDATSSGTISGSAILSILTSPNSIISTISDTIQSINPSVQFTSESIGNIIQQEWSFGDNTASQTINNPLHIFPVNSSGQGVPTTYQISLIVIDYNGCMDTTFKNIFVINDYWMYIPNSFSPDNDQINDKFCIEYSGIRDNTFSFYVMNRLGEVLFKTTNPSSLLCRTNSGWEGKDLNGKDILSGTYVYEMCYQEWDGWKNTKHGTINLVR